MIDIQAKIHDRDALEFKVGYRTRKKLPVSDFEMNTWIFIPDVLDINSKTYDKASFYKDVRSNMRLITPGYLLRDLTEPECLPYKVLVKNCKSAPSDPTRQNMKELESSVKMFASIVKSSVRNAYRHIKFNKIDADRIPLCRSFIADTETVLSLYRQLRQLVNISEKASAALDYYSYGDEFMSNVAAQHTYRLLEWVKKNYREDFDSIDKICAPFLDREFQYKQEMKYALLKEDEGLNNRAFVHHSSLLKKYIESNLYLEAKKKSNTVVVEQIIFSLAAGIAMIFATVISFSFQQTYGNFTIPFFMALVISYMMKDRIKDFFRYYFFVKMGGKYYDNRIKIGIHDDKIGWCKESVDFITSEKLPRPVKEKRNRTNLLEANRGIEEQIMLYRKKLRLRRANLNKISQYPFVGVNDIIRFNLSEFMKRMDNDSVPVFAYKGGGNYQKIDADKVYYLNYVIQCVYQEQVEYKRYRLCISMRGLKEIEEIK